MALFQTDYPCTERLVDVMCDILLDKYKNISVKRLKCVNYMDVLEEKSIKIREKTHKHIIFSCIEPNGSQNMEYNLIHVSNVDRIITVYDFSGDSEKAGKKCYNITKRILTLKKDKKMWRNKCVVNFIKSDFTYLSGFMVPYIMEVLLNDITCSGCFYTKMHELYFDSKRLVKYSILQLHEIVKRNCIYNIIV